MTKSPSCHSDIRPERVEKAYHSRGSLMVVQRWAAMAGAKVVKGFARESDEIRKFDDQNDVLEEQYVGAAEVQSFGNPLMDVIGNLGTVIVLWLGVGRGFLIGSALVFGVGVVAVGRSVAQRRPEEL